MKEAIGELNGVVIVISAVALLAAFFFTFMWPNIQKGMQFRSKCSDAICDVGYNKNKLTYCYMPGDDKKNYFECPYKG